MSFYYPINDSPSWDGYTFVLPSVSVGNVGQLTADLIISTLQMKKAGIIYDESITPVVGNDPFCGCFSSSVGTLHLESVERGQSSAPFLMTSCELYESSAHRLVVMQLRAPLIRGRKAAFRKKLVDFIKEKQFHQVLLLCSSHAHERLDSQLRGDQFRIVTTTSFSAKSECQASVSALNWIELEKRPHREPEKTVDPYLPGGGIAKQFFLLCDRENIPLAVLMVFCSEGDNVPEAFLLANRLNDLTQIVGIEEKRSNWRIPGSWSALFGNPAAETELVFG